MNILPFVLAILFVLSYGMAASLQGRLRMHRNQKAYVALRGAQKRILQKSELEQFKTLGGVTVEKKKGEYLSAQSKKLPDSRPYPVNPSCARLNLYPLIEEGKQAHPALYETAANLLRIFYQGPLFGVEKRFEYRFLDSLLEGAKRKMEDRSYLPLETISLDDPTLQNCYYLSLKGTKNHHLSEKGYPPLIDYVKIDKGLGKVCLFDCHPDMLTVFFGLKTAPKLYAELHNKEHKKEGMDLEAILQWACDPMLALIDPAVWALIDFRRTHHSALLQQTLVEVEDGVSVRKNVLLKGGVDGG